MLGPAGQKSNLEMLAEVACSVRDQSEASTTTTRHVEAVQVQPSMLSDTSQIQLGSTQSRPVSPIHTATSELATAATSADSPEPTEFFKYIGFGQGYKCLKCSFITDSLSNALSHKYVHTGDKPFKCMYCNYAARQKGNLKKHVESRHSGQQETTSPLATASTSTDAQSELQSALSGQQQAKQITFTKHGPREFECNLCQKISVSVKDHSKHYRIHSGERPFQCQYCDYSANQKSHLNRHLKVVHHGCSVEGEPSQPPEKKSKTE